MQEVNEMTTTRLRLPKAMIAAVDAHAGRMAISRTDLIGLAVIAWLGKEPEASVAQRHSPAWKRAPHSLSATAKLIGDPEQVLRDLK